MTAPAGILAATATVLVALLIAGCGSESESESSSDSAVAPLLDRVPGEAYQIKAMDMSTAKRQLGVADDLDPERYGERQVSYTPEERFDTAALEIVDYLAVQTPFATAIDHGLISAGVKATLIPGGPLTILATSQPRAEIARGLQKAGLRRGTDDDVFVFKRGKDAFGLSAVALGDGVVVLAETSEVAAGVLRRTEPDPGLEPTRRLLDTTRGALRTVQRYRSESFDPETACLLGVAGGQRFTPGNENEDLALLLKGEPRASEVTLGEGSQRRDPLTKPYRVTDISRSGQTLSLKVHTTPDAKHLLNVAQIAGGHVPPYLIYRCPGAAAERARRRIESNREILSPSPEPDRSGSRLETLISNYVAKLSTAPNAVRVRCPVQTLPAGTRRLRCTGTRAHEGKTFHYTLRVAFQPSGSIKYIDIHSDDDKTDTIVSPSDPKEKPPEPDSGT